MVICPQCYQSNLPKPPATIIFILKDMMDSATKPFCSQSLNTFDNKTMDTTDQIKDHIAGARATTNACMQASHKPDNNTDNTNLDVGT